MTARHANANELLYDSEAALRLVDSAIEDLRDADPRLAGAPNDPSRATSVRDLLASSTPIDPVGVSEVLARSYGEVIGLLGSLRESRTVLERASVDKLQQLAYASSVLTEMEFRLAELASILDPGALGGPASAADRAADRVSSPNALGQGA